MDMRGSITAFLGPVKLVKKITSDANPDGVNQYTGGGGTKGQYTERGHQANNLSRKADAKSEKAVAMGRGMTKGGVSYHAAAAASHRIAAKAHGAAAQEGGKNAEFHSAMRESHMGSAKWHDEVR